MASCGGTLLLPRARSDGIVHPHSPREWSGWSSVRIARSLTPGCRDHNSVASLARHLRDRRLLLVLVFVMTLLGINSMNSLSDAVRDELAVLRERNVLAQAITHDAIVAIRTGDALAIRPDTLQQARLDSSFVVAGRRTPVVRTLPVESHRAARRRPGELRSRATWKSGVARRGAAPNEPRRNLVADLKLLDEVRALLAVQESAAAQRDEQDPAGKRAAAQSRSGSSSPSCSLAWAYASAVVTVRSVVQPLRRLVRATERSRGCR